MKIFNKVSIIMLAVLFAFVLTGSALAAGPAGVTLGTAGNFTVLAKTGISTTGPTAIVGDIGISPAAATYITGFALTLPSGSAFSTSALVTGKVYAPSYADPTPANMTTAVSDMETAYTDGMGRTNPTATELGAGNIGGMTLAPGLYKWSTGVTIPTDVTLSGGANDIWIFQIAQNLDISSATNVVLSGGAQAGNIFWVVAGQTTLGTTSVFNGNILGQTSIVLNTGATLNGRALAQSAVTLDSNAVALPALVVNSNSSLNNSSSSSSNNTTGGTAGSYNVSPIGTAPTVTAMAGCTGTTGFSATTGLSCSGSTATATVTTPAVIPGCDNGITGFSSVSGVSCASNTGTVPITTSYNFGTVTLRNGSTGAAVMDLQKFLNDKLNAGLVLDGKLGPKTIAAIKTWQADHGLVADGLVGNKTKAQMQIEAEGQ
jgi:hypothetical protein